MSIIATMLDGDCMIVTLRPSRSMHFAPDDFRNPSRTRNVDALAALPKNRTCSIFWESSQGGDETSSQCKWLMAFREPRSPCREILDIMSPNRRARCCRCSCWLFLVGTRLCKFPQVISTNLLQFARRAHSTTTCVGESSCEILTKHTGPFIPAISNSAAPINWFMASMYVLDTIYRARLKGEKCHAFRTFPWVLS